MNEEKEVRLKYGATHWVFVKTYADLYKAMTATQSGSKSLADSETIFFGDEGVYVLIPNEENVRIMQ